MVLYTDEVTGRTPILQAIKETAMVIRGEDKADPVT